MNFEQTYRSMNESIAPSDALLADTLTRARAGQHPKRRLRRAVAVAVAAALVLGCITPALAANVPAVYQALYDISPTIAMNPVKATGSKWRWCPPRLTVIPPACI